MASLTIRNIPEELLEKIRFVSSKNRRSVNSEILQVMEAGLEYLNSGEPSRRPGKISKEAQLGLWNHLSGQWEDARGTEEIIGDIYAARTQGRRVDL